MAKGKVTFDKNNCKGCELCVDACPQKIIVIDKTTINAKGYHPAVVKESEKCTGCANCALMCPDSIITVERD
jgi:2-oxoglutarate ferredoxin oxidoreductase subunit delta